MALLQMAATTASKSERPSPFAGPPGQLQLRGAQIGDRSMLVDRMNLPMTWAKLQCKGY